MKKVLFTLALAAATIGSAAAQGLTYGVKVGANYSNLWGKNKPAGSTYVTGLAAGVAINYAFNDFASLQVEGLYSQKGYKVTDTKVTVQGDPTDPGDVTGDYKVKINASQVLQYIDIPILAKINAGPIFFEAGPQVGLLINSRLRGEYKVKDDATGDVIEHSEYSIADNAIVGYNKLDRNTGGIPTFDIGIIAGVGYNITSGLSFGVRYNAGLKTLVDTKSTPAGDEPRLYNNAFQAQLGYMFGSKE